jgi:hypothetical protein
VAGLCAGTPERDGTDQRRGGPEASRLGKVEARHGCPAKKKVRAPRLKLLSIITALSHTHCGLIVDGTSIYLTRDIGGAIERYEQRKFDKMLYVISSQQDLHTAQFIKMLNLMEFPWAQSVEHVNYGLVLGMSTRKGTVVFLDQIIREAPA